MSKKNVKKLKNRQKQNYTKIVIKNWLNYTNLMLSKIKIIKEN